MHSKRLLLTALIAGPVFAVAAAEDIVYIGTYTDTTSQGIYAYRFDTGSGKLSAIGLAAELTSPSFLAIHPNHKFLYAVSEVDDYNGKKAGAVAAFAIDPKTSKLTLLNKASAMGAGPCHLTVDRTGKFVLVANYTGGSVAVLPIQTDGSLGGASCFIQHTGSSVDKARQEAPHTHSVNMSPDNRFAIVADLGLDKLLVYRFDANQGKLTPNNPPFAALKPGAGPRHFAFHPSGKFAYAINEMHNTVTAFSWDGATGVFHELQTIATLPKEFRAENSTAEVQVHPSGKFLYGSNRGHETIAVFAIDPAKGTLTLVERASTLGKEPRNFGIEPDGGWLIAANQNTDTLVVFHIDPNTGKLTPAGPKVQVARPVCVKFLRVR